MRGSCLTRETFQAFPAPSWAHQSAPSPSAAAPSLPRLPSFGPSWNYLDPRLCHWATGWRGTWPSSLSRESLGDFGPRRVYLPPSFPEGDSRWVGGKGHPGRGREPPAALRGRKPGITPQKRKWSNRYDQTLKTGEGACPANGTSPGLPPPHRRHGNPACPLCPQKLRCLELSLHPDTVLSGGVDGGTAARTGHLLPCLLVAGLGDLKASGLGWWEMLEGRGGG